MSSPLYPNPQYNAPQYPTRASFDAAPPLWAPYYGAPLRDSVQRVFKKYATFTGRASLSEYWWWALANGVLGIVLQIFIRAGVETDASGQQSAGPVAVTVYAVSVLWFVATIVPVLALMVRRLHDVNLSGWLLLLLLVPIAGAIAVFIMTLSLSNPAGQRFDRPPAPAHGA